MKKIELNYTLIKDVQIDGIDHSDAPDYCDAYITSATYDGRDMTDDELDVLNQDSAYIYEKVIDYIY